MFDHYQIELFADPPAKALPGFSEYLNEGVGGPVHVTLTRNRVTMVSVQFTLGGGARVRAHEQFATAAESVWHSLRTYLRTQDRSQWEDVVAFAQSIQVADAEHRTRADSKGQVYDLNTIRDAVNVEFFSGRVKCRIGWGRHGQRARRARSRSIRYGSWNRDARLITLHPLLDDLRVPAEFVKYIVFHEMLHAVVPEARSNGRRRPHSPQFRQLERKYPGFARMQELSTSLLGVLLG